MQFEVIAKCHTTKARVSRMTLARTFITTSTQRQLMTGVSARAIRWCYDASYFHASGNTGGH